MTTDDNKDDEIINVRLPRKDYQTLQRIIQREEAYGYMKSVVATTWVWVVAGGVLAVWMLWDKIRGVG